MASCIFCASCIVGQVAIIVLLELHAHEYVREYLSQFITVAIVYENNSRFWAGKRMEALEEQDAAQRGYPLEDHSSNSVNETTKLKFWMQ